MAKQNWINSENYNIDTSKCTIYYRCNLTPRAWSSLTSSLASKTACHSLLWKKKAQAIVIISNTLILVI